MVKSSVYKKAVMSISPLLDKTKHELVCDSAEKAELLNNHFADVCTMPLTEVNDNPTIQPKKSRYSMSTFLIHESEVFELLSKIDYSKANAPGISGRILKEAAPVVTSVITCLFNESLRHEHFPKAWKLGCITPIFKSGDCHNTSNYRPITLLPILSKSFHYVSDYVDRY
ncbi:unnamed protein product [Didymodactylos carnosus]|uniref:Reverse transcriptase n=1 Tax=Didymodactylos carnosus TaxID=1234261 RepID=A0A8S2YUB7_9BILA|nr:unnamed protein product [Didymodactylos carnosus]